MDLQNINQTTKPTLAKLTKQFRFEAAHHITHHKGKCKNPHGHSYVFEVTVVGEVGQDGFVLDFSDLKQIVNEMVVNDLDHKDLNTLFGFTTSAENLARHIFQQIELGLSHFTRTNKCKIKLHNIHLWEIYPTSSVTVEAP